MKWLLQWLGLFQPTLKNPKPVKFVEGLEATCPDCGVTIAVARRDVLSGEAATSTAWEVERPAAFYRFRHCHSRWLDFKDGKHVVHTPTGWVG